MRKFYLLLTLVSSLFLHSIKAQDTASFNLTLTSGSVIYFINTSHLHGDAYRKAYWSFGDGIKQQTAALGSTSHHYNNQGSYTACLRIYKYQSNTHDSALTAESCKTFSLPIPTPDTCKANFTDTSFAHASPLLKRFQALPWHNHNKIPEQICWNFGDNHDTCIHYNPSIPNNYVAYHTYSKPGEFNVCVTIKYQGGCESTHFRTIHAGIIDSCRSDFNEEPVAGSTLLSRHFIALPWNGLQKKVLRVCWHFGDGRDTCIQYASTFTGSYSVNHTYANFGQYNACVTILYDGGCESEKCKMVSLPRPVADTCFVNILEAAGSINNFEHRFYATLMPNRIPEAICWYFGDGTDSCISLPEPAGTTALAIAHHFPAPGVYHVCVKVRYKGSCQAYKCIEVVIQSNTNICGGYMTDSLINAKTYLFKGHSVMKSSDHVINWQWTFGDGSSANTEQAIHTYSNGGNYEVCLYIRSDLGCETKICKRVAVQGNNEPQLQLSPNPVTSVLHVLFHSAFPENVTVSIYNANGLMVKKYTKNALAGANTWDFDVSVLPAGIYSVIVSSPHQLANAIFFKQ